MAIMGATQLYENPHAKIRTGISLVSRLCAFGDIWVDTDCLLDCFLVFSRCEKPIKSSFRDIDNLVECVAMFYFIKGLSCSAELQCHAPAACRCPDGLTVALHDAFYVGLLWGVFQRQFSPIMARNWFSSITGMPRVWAFSRLDGPMFSPAST